MGEGSLDELVDEIQEQIREEEERLYSERVREEAANPFHMMVLEEYDGCSSYTGQCGDTMKIFLKLEESEVKDASYITDGCGVTVAVGSILMKRIIGMRLEKVEMMTSQDLEEVVGRLPPENQHCPSLAVTALHMAIDDLYAQGVVQ